MSGNGNETTVWEGYPALRPYFFNPLYLAAAALSVALVAWGTRSGAVLTLDGLKALPATGQYLPTMALLGGIIIACVLGYILLDRRLTTYELTSQRLILKKGVLARELDEIELYRIRDVKLTRGIFQRLMGLGTVHVDSTDGTGRVSLVSIPASERVREQIRNMSERMKTNRGSVIVG